jgi:glycine betaine/proline transport system substrate-binding protein
MRPKTLPELLIAGLLAFGPGTAAVAKEAIKIGWTAWSDAELVTKLAARLLEDRMGYDVELLQTDIAPQHQGLASGSIDVMLMSWQPETHEDDVKKVGDKVVYLGLLYTHARLGWVVPDYIPETELKSIEDLRKPEVRETLDGTVTGIDPGAGLTRLSKKAMYDAQETSYDEAVAKYIENNPERIDYWVTGEL